MTLGAAALAFWFMCFHFTPLLRHLAGMVACLVFSGAIKAGEGQAFLTRFWQTSDGMPSNVVYAVERDAAGFLWIGTGAGVARFDGVRFSLFNEKSGLPDTQITALHIDRRGRVWVGTRRGAAFREIGAWSIPPGLDVEEVVYALGESADGAIWLGTYQGCRRWDGRKTEEIKLAGARRDTRAFLDDGAGGMWIVTEGHLCQWQPEFGSDAKLVPGPWDGADLRGIARDAKGRLVICGSGALWRQNGTGWDDLAAAMPRGRESANLACAAARDGTLWVATRNLGLVFLDENGWGSVDSSRDLSLDDVRALMIDAEGLVWAGTNGGGINRLRRRLFDTYSATEGLGRTVTSALVADRAGTLWAGTDGSGILRYKNGRFLPFDHMLGAPGERLIWSLCATSNDGLWIGTYQNGLLRMRDDEIERIALTDATPKNAISALCETRDGGLLIGTHHDGLLKWKDGKVERVFTTPDGAKTLIHAILEARTGDIWLAAASSGLWRFHSGEWKRPGERSGERLIATALMESAAGDLWIGTLGQGLVRFHADHLTAWTREDGLISDTIVQMLEDDAGNLWLGTDAGLQRVSPAALAASRAEGRRTRIAGMGVTREDGLPTPQFSGEHGNLATRTPDGSLWFSLASGAIRVQPERFAETSAPPAILIESASADRDELWNHENPRAQEGMAIEPGAGTLRIRFTAPDFIAPEKMRFKYRMAGLETGWQENAGARNASYASLPPGTYQFQMMGAAHDGTWSPAPVSVKIVVKPFFWQTTAFRAFASIASLAALTYLLWTWSLRRIRRRMALLEQERRVEKERARIAQDLHDELGASLTEINFLGTLAAGSIGESPARKRMEGIVDRAQRMAKSLDEIVWTVNPANDSLSSTANYLCSRAQECLRAADIRCRLEIDEHLPAMTLDSELRHHLLMAVNEAVNNVMKHSGTRDCTLRVSLEHGSLIVCVEDTGAGFDAHHPPSGRNGLTNLKRRMENIGGRCTIDTTPGRGTRVRLVIPLLRASGTRFDAGAN